jgi:hypothetical protein
LIFSEKKLGKSHVVIPTPSPLHSYIQKIVINSNNVYKPGNIHKLFSSIYFLQNLFLFSIKKSKTVEKKNTIKIANGKDNL